MTRATYPRLGLAVTAMLLAAMAGTGAQAQDEAQRAQAEAERAQEQLDRTPEDCVLMNRVARNIAVDNFSSRAARTTSTFSTARAKR